jgi:hypothetical protein
MRFITSIKAREIIDLPGLINNTSVGDCLRKGAVLFL